MADRWYETGFDGSVTNGKKLKLHVYTIEHDIINNTSKERADVYMSVTNTTGNWWNNYGSTAWVYVNGNQKEETATFDARYINDKLLIGSFDTIVDHNDDGKKTIQVSASYNTGTGLGHAYVTGDYVCDTIPRASTVTLSKNNISIGETITIKINAKSSKFRHIIKMQAHGSTLQIAYDVVGDVVWNTSENADWLYSLIPNKNSSYGGIVVETYDGGTKIGESDTRIDFNVVNANPIFNNFTFKDINTKTVALTGSNQKIISGYSNVEATISTANKAEAQKKATMSKYRLQIGIQQVDADYSNTEDVSMALNNVDNNVIRVYAIDSRGNTTAKDLSPSAFLQYTNIKITNASISRANGGVSTEVALSLSGEFWNNNFGAKINSIKSLKVQYKSTNSSTWIDGDIIIPSINQNIFSKKTAIKGDLGAEGFSANNSFDIRIKVEDELSTFTMDLILGSGKPAIAIHRNGIAVGKPYDETQNGNIQGIYDVGDIFLSTNPANPNAKFGGTWELIAKGRTLVGVDQNDEDFNEVCKTGGSKYLQKHTHKVQAVGTGKDIILGDSTWGWSDGVVPKSATNGGTHIIATETGSGNSENVQPYFTCYIWMKTA